MSPCKLDLVVGVPRTGLLRGTEKREGTCRMVRRLNALEHSFIAEVLHRVPRLVKAARTCAAKRSRALTSLGTRCDFAARKEYLQCSLSVGRGCRDHQDSSGKSLPLIADGKLARLTEDAGVEHCGRERPGTPEGVLAPKNGDKPGSLPATVWIFPRRNCSWFQLGSSGAATACSAVALDRDADRKVDRAFWSEGLTGRAFRQHKKS